MLGQNKAYLAFKTTLAWRNPSTRIESTSMSASLSEVLEEEALAISVARFWMSLLESCRPSDTGGGERGVETLEERRGDMMVVKR